MNLLRVAANIVATPIAPPHGRIEPQAPTAESCVISSVAALDESKGLKVHEQQQQSRRAALCLLGAVSFPLVRCDEASAFSPGYSGLKDWLKGQKQKTSQFLLAPIEASRDRLNSALLLLTEGELSNEGIEEAGRLVKVASRDCMPAADGSLIRFQSKTGVEVCTFKLVLKNAASLLADDDPVKLIAEQNLQALIRSFVTLDGLFAASNRSDSVDKESLTRALRGTSRSLDEFDAGIRACLGIP